MKLNRKQLRQLINETFKLPKDAKPFSIKEQYLYVSGSMDSESAAELQFQERHPDYKIVGVEETNIKVQFSGELLRAYEVTGQIKQR